MGNSWCGCVGDKRRNVPTSKELAEIQLDNFCVIDSNMYSSKVISMILKRKLLKLVINERKNTPRFAYLTI
jgi:hypothetical protein